MKRRGFFRALFGGATCTIVPKPKAVAMLSLSGGRGIGILVPGKFPSPQNPLTSSAFIPNAFISRYYEKHGIDIGRIEEWTRFRGVQ